MRGAETMTDRPDLKLYSLQELSQILGVTHRTAWNYVKAGKLKAVKIGGAWKVTEENLKKFINGES
jgi:excisionase family DNA binding protein